VGAPLPITMRLMNLVPAHGSPTLFDTMPIFNVVKVTLIITAGIPISSMVAGDERVARLRGELLREETV
jgi:hypothetical protein